MKQALKILLVDDHPIVRTSCRRMLEAHYQAEYYEALNGAEAYQLFKDHKPDLTILDITLPGIGGLEVLKRIRSQEAGALVIIFSMHDDAIFAQHALEQGAMAYVCKSGEPEEILTAIQLALQGKTYVSPPIQAKLQHAKPTTLNPLTALSPRELELLRLIGAGVNLKAIADCLNISYKTAANNCTLLKSKLGVAQTTELVRIAMLHGLS